MLNFKKDIAVLDLETTGFNPYEDEITEICIVILDGVTGEQKSVFSSLVKIQGSVPTKVEEITHISDELLETYGAPIELIAPIVKEMLKDVVIVAHNIEFDGQWLDVKFGIKPKFFYDTLSIDRLEFTGEKSHNLSSVCERLGIELNGAHRAINDVLATCEVFLKQMSLHKDNKVKYMNVMTETQYGIRYVLDGAKVEVC